MIHISKQMDNDIYLVHHTTVHIQDENEIDTYYYEKTKYYKSILGRIGLLSFILATICLNIFFILLSNLSLQDLHYNDTLIKVIIGFMMFFYVISLFCYCFVIM